MDVNVFNLRVPKTRPEWLHLLFMGLLTLTAGMAAKEAPVSLASGGRITFGEWYAFTLLTLALSLFVVSILMAAQSRALAAAGIVCSLLVAAYTTMPQL